LANRLRELLGEARRRKVFRTAGVYLVAVWGLSQGAVELAPLFGAPDWALRALVIGAIACLPGVVTLAWMFDIGLGGIRRDPEDLAQVDEDDLASMPTMIGSDAVEGGVIVRWKDGRGENAALFTEEFFVGRGSDCRVRFYDPLVSRRHARVYPDDGAWCIEDLGSRNGTILGETRIERAELGVRNEVRVNEAGPPLHLEVLKPGHQTVDGLSRHAGGPRVAHVRSGSDGTLTSREAPSRTRRTH